MAEQLKRILEEVYKEDPQKFAGPVSDLWHRIDDYENSGDLPRKVEVTEQEDDHVYENPHFTYSQKELWIMRNGEDFKRRIPSSYARILNELVSNVNAPVTRERLNYILNENTQLYASQTNVLETNVSKIRNEIGWNGADRKDKSPIITVKGIGYMLEDEKAAQQPQFTKGGNETHLSSREGTIAQFSDKNPK